MSLQLHLVFIQLLLVVHGSLLCLLLDLVNIFVGDVLLVHEGVVLVNVLSLHQTVILMSECIYDVAGEVCILRGLR